MPRADTFVNITKGMLFICLSAVCVLVPIEWWNHKSAELQEQAAARTEASKLEAQRLADQKAAPPRISLAGSYMYGFQRTLAKGTATFSNVSPRQGVVCVKGVLVDKSGQTTTTLPECKKVGAYETGITFDLPFAGSSVKELCPTDDSCNFKVQDVQDQQE